MGLFDMNNNRNDFWSNGKKDKDAFPSVFGKKVEKKEEKRPNEFLHPIKATKWDIKKSFKIF